MGSIPSVTQKVQPEQSMHWTNITTIVGESTHIVNRIKSLTVPYGSRLMLIFFSSGRCFSCCLLGVGRLVRWRRSASQLAAVTSTVSVDLDCVREAVQLPSRLQFIDRLGRPGLRNAKLFGFPPGCSFLGREHDLRKILIRHQIHSAKNNFWE